MFANWSNGYGLFVLHQAPSCVYISLVVQVCVCISPELQVCVYLTCGAGVCVGAALWGAAGLLGGGLGLVHSSSSSESQGPGRGARTLPRRVNASQMHYFSNKFSAAYQMSLPVLANYVCET